MLKLGPVFRTVQVIARRRFDDSCIGLFSGGWSIGFFHGVFRGFGGSSHRQCDTAHLLEVLTIAVTASICGAELGEGSPEIVILRVDPKTQATQLMIRVPKDFHVPRHWHSANETHTTINGTFILQHGNDEREELRPGSFSYIPRKMVHQGWTKPDEGALLFISVDGAWDSDGDDMFVDVRGGAKVGHGAAAFYGCVAE